MSLAGDEGSLGDTPREILRRAQDDNTVQSLNIPDGGARASMNAPLRGAILADSR